MLKKEISCLMILIKKISSFDILEVDIIGPSIGEQLKRTSIVIVYWPLLLLFYCIALGVLILFLALLQLLPYFMMLLL